MSLLMIKTIKLGIMSLILNMELQNKLNNRSLFRKLELRISQLLLLLSANFRNTLQCKEG